ncbi:MULTISPECIES: efflux transporter outer membrane subunit [Chryseobacterium]|uniref:efflux transporter outer membrane subunit n=1 Tax=Chryseobacterium TaxID=59732 RepID=UPI001297FF38|nr:MULTISPECIES: efflux transporter outer membrane subunit [Chryseobacterium]MDR6919621.1 NodT family efflux transporter outer membrane factor (OMF) lipoprotein [Chryseobacterium sp. 2987]
MNSIKNIAYIALISGAAVSCKVQKYERPEVKMPEVFRGDSITTDTQENIAKTSYRDFFKDPVLVALIDKAVTQNNDLLVALKQIEFASLAYNQSKWGNVPVISGGLNANISRPSDNSMNGMMAGQFMGKRYMEDYTASLNFSWEADIWGKIRGRKEQALTEYLKTQEAAKAVKTQLVASVVQGYYNLLMLDTQMEITKSNLTYADNTLKFLAKQQELGLTTALAVQQQEIVKDQILKSIPAIESSIATQENALSLLTGSMPDRIERSASLNNVQSPDHLATGIPSELLSYRPDIKSAELEVRKSAAAIHVAKMSMYPSLNITAQGGLNAFQASQWFSIPGSLFGMAAGAIAQPILNGKQLKTQYEQSKVLAGQAEISFKQSVLKAVGEVSDALVQIQKLEEQQKIAEGLVVKSNEAVKKADILFKYNSATYIEVIIAQTNKLQTELDLASLKAQRLNAITTLYRAVGGGWQ